MTFRIKSSAILILTLFIFTHKTNSKTVVKCETSPEFIFSEYKVFSTSDYFTPFRELISNGKVTKPGEFSFEVNNDEVWVLDIEINDFKKTFFIDKDSEYIIKFENRAIKYPIIINEPDNNINSAVFLLTRMFDTLNYIRGTSRSRSETLSHIIGGVKTGHQLRLMKKLIDEISQQEDRINDKFLSEYYIYYLAPYRAILADNNYGIDSLIKFENSLFNNSTILYSNPAFADCFSIFTLFINYHIYVETTKIKNRDFSFYNKLNFCSAFNNPELKELAKLIVLNNKMGFTSYNNNSRQLDNLLQISDSIGGNTKFTNITTVSSDIRKKYTEQNKLDIPAPDFSLPDRNGDIVSLSDFKGKHVYFDFWAVWCNHCREHHKELSLIKEKLNGKVIFISISVDKLEKSMIQYQDNHPEYDWTFLWAGDRSKITKDYNIFGYPTNFLINKEGKIVYRSGVGIKKDFDKIMKLTNK